MEPGPFNDNPAREQSSQILERLQDCHSKFVEIQQAAKKAHSRLSQERDPSPAQCERMTRPLFQLDDSIQLSFNLLQQKYPLLPYEVREHYHQILLMLSNIEDTIEKLRQNIASFVSNSYSSSLQTSKVTNKEIIENVAVLEQQLTQFNKLLNSILIGLLPPQPDANDLETIQLSKNEKASSVHGRELITSSPPVDNHQPFLAQFISFFLKKVTDIYKIRQSLLIFSKPVAQPKVEPEQSSVQSSQTMSNLANPGLSEDAQYDAYYDELYQKLADYILPFQIREICMKLRIEYNRLEGESHHERAFFLARLLYNQKRLSELETELRILIPNRFPPPSEENKM